MGLVLDTSILIDFERRRLTLEQILEAVVFAIGEAEAVLSTVSVVELTHGMYRARTEADRKRRKLFAEGVFEDLSVHPVTLEIAQFAGRIEGEQAALGNVIAFEDLLIGATALHLGYEVATLNTRHFERIPGLNIVTL